jgi:hypothetical protein
MMRAVVVLVLVAVGAVALVFGINIRTQLIEMFSPGLSGAMCSLVVALSPGHQAQVAWYQQLSTTLLAGGGAALLIGLVAGITGMEQPQPQTQTRKKKAT